MNYLTEDPKWVSFYPKFNSDFYIEKAGYFDERPQISTSVTQLIALFCLPLVFFSAWFLLLLPFVFFGWGMLYIKLPIKTGIQDCESGAYGFAYHDNTIWIYIGGGGNDDGGKKWKTISMPWTYDWVRTSTYMADGTWFDETKEKILKWRGDGYGTKNWLSENKWTKTLPFVDKVDNKTVNATIHVEIMEWRPRAFKWTSLFSKSKKSIYIDFDNEVGREKDSWKGGVLGCSYELKEGETPEQCLKRMEQERKF